MDNMSEDLSEIDGGCFGKPNKITFPQNTVTEKENIITRCYQSLPDEIHKNLTTLQPHYKMNHKHRGKALIFNHIYYRDKKIKPRRGSDRDKDALKRTFLDLHFEVDDFNDLDYDDIMGHINIASKLDYSKRDCVVVVILSHGDPGIIHAKDMTYNPKHLWSQFSPSRNPTLEGKPVLFFINACQGDKYDDGIICYDPIDTTYNNNLDPAETDISPFKLNEPSFEIPNQPDLLVAYSTIPGYYSWRSPEKGSWFIQTLCKQLNENMYTKDLQRILTDVNLNVALNYESITNTPEINMKKQIPCSFSTLTKLLIFEENMDKHNCCTG